MILIIQEVKSTEEVSQGPDIHRNNFIIVRVSVRAGKEPSRNSGKALSLLRSPDLLCSRKNRHLAFFATMLLFLYISQKCKTVVFYVPFFHASWGNWDLCILGKFCFFIPLSKNCRLFSIGVNTINFFKLWEPFKTKKNRNTSSFLTDPWNVV